MVDRTRRLVGYPCLEQLQASLHSIITQNTYRGSSVLNQIFGRAPFLKLHSLQTQTELQTTPVCVDYLRRETKLKDSELIRIVSSVETIGFNSVGQVCLNFAFSLSFTGWVFRWRSFMQMYRKSSPEGLDFGKVRNVMEHFQSIEGVNTGRLIRNSPFILASSTSFLDQFEVNKNHLMDLFNLDEKELGKILSSNAYVLSRSARYTVQPCAEYLRRMNFSGDQIRSIIIRFPRILALSTSKMDNIREYLRGIGIDNQDFAKIVWKFPPVMGLSASKIELTKKWLVEQGLSSKNDLKTCLLKFPQIMSHSLEEKFEPIINYMLDDLRLQSDVVKIALLCAPDVFGRTLDRIKYNVAALKSIGMSHIDLTRYLASFPGGLRLDIHAEPYRSKLEYLEKNLGQKPATVLPVHPRYLSYSMERIACRAEYLQSKQRSTNGVTGWCAASDILFAEKFARSSLSEWSAFKSAWQLAQAQ